MKKNEEQMLQIGKILGPQLKIERIWCMPNRNTFKIHPIANLLREEMVGELWIDPFCGNNSPAHVTNDLNPDIPADSHEDAIVFLKMFDNESVDGVLYDPPYSVRQVAECYKRVGFPVTQETTRANFWSNSKNEAARIIRVGGKAICCGWNTMGLGINRGFRMDRILLVPHGGPHNDTIVTVETKVKHIV